MSKIILLQIFAFFKAVQWTKLECCAGQFWAPGLIFEIPVVITQFMFA